MTVVQKFVALWGFITLSLAGSAMAQAANVYITQNGSPSGNCSTNVQTPSFFNTASNWGNGASQIGAGTVVHLCGTFTASAGTNCYLTFQSSGTSTSPIDLYFDGATLTAPYWTNAICATNLNNLLIDGGTNGTITATANGTGLANQQPGTGVNIASGSGIEIRNLTISNMYIHSGTGEDGENTDAILLQYSQNYNIHNNTINDVRNAILFYFANGTGGNVNNNNTSNAVWHLSFQSQCDGKSGESDLLTGLNIYSNTISGFNNWYDTGFNNHFDGIMLSASCYGSNPSEITDVNIYDNTITGPMNQWGTGMIYGANHVTNSYIFNNLLVLNYAAPPTGLAAHPDGLIVLTSGTEGGPTNVGVYNNTFWFDPLTQGVGYRFANSATNVTLENNILVNPYRIIDAYYTNIAAAGYGLVSNYNVYYNLGSQYAMQDNIQTSGNYYTLAQWQAMSPNYDPNVSTGNPNLNSSYVPQQPSSAIAFGTNLTSLGVTLLDTDMAGNLRPPTGNWDDGAFMYISGAPAPPTGLTAVVQ
jgi:hypothetical protein